MGACAIAVASGIAHETDSVLGSQSNIGSEMTTALTVINLISTYLSLQKEWSEKLTEDAENIFTANMDVPGNPAGTAGVAAATEARNTDSTKSNQETGIIDNIIQGQKGAAQMEGNTLSGILSMVEPMADFMSSLVGHLRGFLKQ